MNKTSLYLRVRNTARNDGNSSLYLLKTVNGMLQKIHLSIYWPENLVDKDANNLKPRKR